MGDVMTVVLPFLSVLLGAAITYSLNVRQRRRGKVEDVFHDAIGAVAVAHAAHDFISALAPWAGATDEESREFNSQISREGNHGYVRAVADARAALARASAYDPALASYIREPGPSAGSEAVYERADEIMAHLRTNIEGRR